jgi:hypothetical protein
MISMMKALTIGLMAIPSANDDDMMAATARSASLPKQIALSCSGQFNVDQENARKLEQVFIEVGNESYGAKKFSGILKKEYIRRASEVRGQGATSWCLEQRKRMIEMGAGSLFHD